MVTFDIGASLRRWAIMLLLATGALAATPAAACDVATPPSASLGRYSATELKTNTAAVATDGSFICTHTALLTLLNTDFLKATLSADVVLTGPGGSVPVTLSIDPAGTRPFVAGKAAVYRDGALLTLLDNSLMRPIVYATARSATELTPGTYTGFATVRWDWQFCTQVGALGLCALGKTDAGSKPTRIDLTLVVTPKPATVTLGTTTTWSPTSNTYNPKAVPGAKVRIAATIANPDVVPLDADTVAVTLATPPTMRLALEGDGTAANRSVDSAQGTKASGLSLTYASPGSTADDVDFSADNGVTWTYVPVPGDATSQGAVTNLRFRPRGSMAAQSSFVVSLPFTVR